MPVSALDIAGNVRFSSVPFASYTYLSVDNDGYVFTTGNISGASGELWSAGFYAGTGLVHYP